MSDRDYDFEPPRPGDRVLVSSDGLRYPATVESLAIAGHAEVEVDDRAYPGPRSWSVELDRVDPLGYRDECWSP